MTFIVDCSLSDTRTLDENKKTNEAIFIISSGGRQGKVNHHKLHEKRKEGCCLARPLFDHLLAKQSSN